MARPFDAALKDLIESYPADWLPLAGLKVTAPIEVIAKQPRHRAGGAVALVNALLRHRHGNQVRSVLFLLRPAADSPGLTGVFEQQFPGEPAHDLFRYQVVRVWTLPVQTLLGGGLGTLPLAPLSAVAETDLPEVVRQIDDRLQREASPEQAGILTAAALVLAGLRLPRDQAVQLFQGAHFMSIVKDSSVYEWFLEEGMKEGVNKGMIQGARKVILRQGEKRFGAVDAATAAAIEAITDLSRLERMSERLLDAASWSEVLETT